MRITFDIDPKIKIPRSKIEDLIDLPVVIRVTEFDEESAIKFSDDMRKAHDKNQPIIPIVIDSFGGQVYSLISMISEIENSKIPVATIGVGKSMSCGSILLSCGTDGYRFMHNLSTVMIHDVSGFEVGKIEELKSGVKEAERLHKIIFHKMAENCGHTNKDYFLEIIHNKGHAEWYLDAKEAKKHKIINHIGVPHFHIDVNAEINFVKE